MFANGEQGWVYDPSNMATLFQDSAGTTPVTAMEQPVGLQLDLSGRGNHRFQSTNGNRPVVSARVNILTKTEQFDNFIWIKAPSGSATFQGTGLQAVVTADYGVAPNGTMTADRVQLNCNGGTSSSDRSGFNQDFTVSIGVSYTVSYYVKFLDSTTDGQILASSFGTLAAGTLPTSSVISDVGNGWKQVVRVYTPSSSIATLRFQITGSTGPQTIDALVWGADLRPTNQGVGLPVYQRVNTSTDYDSVGFPVYIKPNGTNQFLMTNSIDFTATDEITVWQGVRKLRDSTQSVIAELSASVAANNGAFLLSAPNSAAANYNFSSKGTSQADNTVTTYTSPITNVLAAAGDISGASNSIKINGGSATVVTSSQGAGTYGNYAAYFYMRAGSSLPFNGNDYGSIVRGAASTAAQIQAGEIWINQRTKAY